jgi:hypothetical protein
MTLMIIDGFDDDDDDDNDDDKHIGHSPGIWFSSPHQNQKRAQ